MRIKGICGGEIVSDGVTHPLVDPTGVNASVVRSFDFNASNNITPTNFNTASGFNSCCNIGQIDTSGSITLTNCEIASALENCYGQIRLELRGAVCGGATTKDEGFPKIQHCTDPTVGSIFFHNFRDEDDSDGCRLYTLDWVAASSQSVACQPCAVWKTPTVMSGVPYTVQNPYMMATFNSEELVDADNYSYTVDDDLQTESPGGKGCVTCAESGQRTRSLDLTSKCIDSVWRSYYGTVDGENNFAVQYICCDCGDDPQVLEFDYGCGCPDTLSYSVTEGEISEFSLTIVLKGDPNAKTVDGVTVNPFHN